MWASQVFAEWAPQVWAVCGIKVGVANFCLGLVANFFLGLSIGIDQNNTFQLKDQYISVKNGI